MRLNQTVTALRLVIAATLLALAQAGMAAAQESSGPPRAEPVALDDTAAIQDVTEAAERHMVDLGAGSGAPEQAAPAARDAEMPWFGLKLANPTSLPMERLLVVKRPLLAGAGWSVGVSSALPPGAAVEWVGAGAPEALPALPGAGGAGVFRFTVPPGGTAQLAVPGAEGPVVAAVMTRGAYDATTSVRFIILGLGFGLLGVLAALSLARWLGAGDRAAAASAGVGLAAIWVLATQFGHHLPLVGAGSPFDPGLKAAGLFLLAGALLFSVRMQAALSDRFLGVLTWCAVGCVLLALLALPGWGVVAAAGPVLMAAAFLALAAAITDALNHRAHLSVRLPDLASLAVLVAVLAAAGVLAAGEPALTADRWSVILHGALIVSLAVLGGSGLIVHHGVAVPLIEAYHPVEPEMPEALPAAQVTAVPEASEAPEGAETVETPEPAELPVTAALGPEPETPDLAAHEVAAEQTPAQTGIEDTLRTAEAAAAMVGPSAPEPAASPEAAAAEPELLRDLREALDCGLIRVEYQPVVGLTDGRVAGFEALARWEREGHGPVPPDTFIPLAEEAGLIGELGGQVLEEAVRRLGEWQRQYGEAGAKLRMNVNISALQLAMPDFPEAVRTLTERERLHPDTLTLELTETVPIDDSGGVAANLVRLKEQGVKLALDDFGSGYSSLDYLRTTPFDSLKIDRSLLASMPDERGRRILRAIIELAHDLNMTVIAEGVQHAADLEKLRALRCDYVQGPFCGPPLKAEAAEAVLRKDKGASPPDETGVTTP